jgi:hypothetical protein
MAQGFQPGHQAPANKTPSAGHQHPAQLARTQNISSWRR